MTTPATTVDQRYQVRASLLKQDTQQGMIFLDPETLKVHELNTTMARIMQLCTPEQSCARIAAQISVDCAIDIQDAATETYLALKQLLELRLIEPVKNP